MNLKEHRRKLRTLKKERKNGTVRKFFNDVCDMFILWRLLRAGGLQVARKKTNRTDTYPETTACPLETEPKAETGVQSNKGVVFPGPPERPEVN